MRICIDILERVLNCKTCVPSLAKPALYLLCLCLLICPGCRWIDWDSATLRSSIGSREIAPNAIHHNSKGLKYLSQGKIAKAETHFLKAIDYDPTFAAAHNNLGNMLLGRRDLYQAAWEFQRASELEPNSIEPLINLGLLHDEADRLDEAAEFYMQALQIDPRNPIALGNLARVRVKQENDPIEIHNMLRDLVLIDTRAEWVEWAQELLATRYRPDYGASLSSQPLADQKRPGDATTPPLLNTNPLRHEQVLPDLSYPTHPPQEPLPSPGTPLQVPTPHPSPTLMDIPRYNQGQPTTSESPTNPVYLEPIHIGSPGGTSFPNRPNHNGLHP